jgi:hypothetical protein
MSQLDSTAKCSLSRFGAFSPIDFYRMACANCYTNLNFVIPGIKVKYEMLNNGYLTSPLFNQSIMLDPSLNDHKMIIKEDMDFLEYEKWQSCCSEAQLCCDNVMANPNASNFGTNLCKPIWDGWACHKATRAGEMSIVKCPDHVIADTCNAIVGKLSDFL